MSCSASWNLLKEKITNLETVTVQKQKEQALLCEKAIRLEEKCAAKDIALEQLNQYSWRNNVILDGIPEVAGETSIVMICRIAEATGFKIEEGDVDACHQLPRQWFWCS